jgi:hypothetical protein
MSDPTVSPHLPSLNQLRKAMTYLTLYSGLALLPLLPIGMLEGISSPWFDGIFFLHLLLLACALCSSLVFFWRCALRSNLSILLVAGGFIVFLAVMVLEASHPITSRDALIHHLAVPKWWIQSDRIVSFPWHEWSFYPMLVNLGYTGLMKYGLDRWTPLYHLSYLVLTCGVISSFVLYKTQNYTAATFAMLLTWTLPVCMRLASSPLVDLGLGLYVAQAFCHLAYWAEGKHKTSHLIIAGAALGLALGCKYNGMLACALCLSLTLVFIVRSKLKFSTALRAVFLVGFCAFLVYLPWLAKNALWTNNPFFPLFNNLFGTTSTPTAIKGLSPLSQRVLLYHEDWLDLVTIPLQMLVLGEDGNPRRFDGVLSPILLLGLVPLWRSRREPWVAFFWLFCLSYLGFALILSSARVRYLAPLFGPLLILTSVGIYQFAQLKGAKYSREVYQYALAISLLWSACYAGSMLAGSSAASYLQSSASADEYLREHIAEYPAIQYVNRNVPDASIVYLLNTGNRFYYYNKQVRSSGHFSANQILGWIRSAQNTQFLASEFRNRGIDYLMTNTELTRSGLQEMLTIDERSVWNDFQTQHLELAFAQGAFSVWKIK